jgi:tetratricopeptide (TPR) repeat protein
LNRRHVLGIIGSIIGCSGAGGGQRSPAATPDAESPAFTMQAVPAQGSSPSATGKVSKRPSMNAAAKQSYDAGRAAFSRGDLNGALAQYSEATRADPKAYAAHWAMGVVLERLDRASEARSAYERALSIVSDYELAIAAQTELLMRSVSLQAAEGFLQNLKTRHPESAAVLAALSEVRSRQGDSGEAQRLAQDALKSDPDYRPAMLALARDHYRHRRLDLALYTLAAILDGYGPENPPRDRDNGAAVMLRAMIYKDQGRRALAMAEFQRVVELRPDLVAARVQVAKYMLEAGNADGAVQLLEGALAYAPQDIYVHLALGDAYRLQGRPGPAIEHLEWVLAADGSIAAAEYNLGLLYLLSAEVPGRSKLEAADKAIHHLSRYEEMSGSGQGGAGGDVGALLQRARNKRAIVEALAEEPRVESPPAGEVEGEGGSEALPVAESPPEAPSGAGGTEAPPTGSTGSFEAID